MIFFFNKKVEMVTFGVWTDQSRAQDVTEITQNLQVEKQVWMWSAAIEGRGRRGEVVSVMAVLHNFWEREQKESEGKWKAKRSGGVLVEEVRRGTAFFTSYTKWAEKWKHWARSLNFLKKGICTEFRKLKRWDWDLWVDLVVGNKWLTHRPTRPLWQDKHTLVDGTVAWKRMRGALLPVEY